jgi:hypothetical protein
MARPLEGLANNAPDKKQVQDYLSALRKYQDAKMKNAAVFGIIAFGVSLAGILPKFGNMPGWFRKAPCIFQSTLSAFALLVSTADLVLDLIKILPMLGVAILAFWHLRSENRTSPNSEWKPVNQKALWFLFVGKLFGPLVLFTIVNFKLPQYAPYDEIAGKACEVAVSLVYFPLQPSLAGDYKYLRRWTELYFRNEKNHMHPNMKNFESSLGILESDKVGALVDSELSCTVYNAGDNGAYTVLNKFYTPDVAIKDYCANGLKEAKQIMPFWDAVEFPVETLGKHFKNIISGLAITFEGCKIKRPESTTKVQTNVSLSFTQVCEAFYQTVNYSSIEPFYRPYITEEKHMRFASGIRQQASKRSREVSCVYIAELFDPRTGFASFPSLTCGRAGWVKQSNHAVTQNLTDAVKIWQYRWMDGYKGAGGEANVTNRTIEDLEFAWVGNSTAGNNSLMNDDGYDYIKGATWTTLAESMEASIDLFEYNLTELKTHALRRWVLQDARDMNLNAADYNKMVRDEEARRQYNSLLAQLQARSDDVNVAYSTPNASMYDLYSALAIGGKYDSYSMSHLKTTVRGKINTLTTEVFGSLVYMYNSFFYPMIGEAQMIWKSSYEAALNSYVTTVVATWLTVAQFAETVAATMSSGVNKVRMLIGTFIGFMAVSKMAPFAISVTTGIYAGSIRFKKLIDSTDTFSNPNDAKKLKLFTGLVIFLTGSVTAVPIITVTIFVYQAYADQYFIMFVLGIEIFVFLKMMKGLLRPIVFAALNYLALSLMLAGIVTWAIMDPDQMVQLALFAKDNMPQNVLTVSKMAANFVFNFYFSKLVTLNAVASLAGAMFSEYDKVYYRRKKGKYVQSQLFELDVWQRRRKPATARKSPGRHQQDDEVREDEVAIEMKTNPLRNKRSRTPNQETSVKGRKQKNADLTGKVQNHPDSSPTIAAAPEPSSYRSVYMFPPGQLGLALTESENSHGDTIVSVEAFLEAFQSENFTTLSVGHIIERIGSRNVIGLDFEHVVEIIKSEPRPCEYVFRDPDLTPVLEMAPDRTAYSFAPGSLGIGLSEKTQLNGDLIVFVENIVEGSQSANFKSLKVGHIIEKIGSRNVIGLDFDHVIEIVERTERPCDYIFRDHTGGELTPDRTAYTFALGSIGMGLTEKIALNGERIVCIDNIVEGSQSDNFKTLKVGHIIEKIGCKCVIGLDFERVIEIVKDTERPCKYVFRNPKQNALRKRLTRRLSLPVEMNMSFKTLSSRVIKKRNSVVQFLKNSVATTASPDGELTPDQTAYTFAPGSIGLGLTQKMASNGDRIVCVVDIVEGSQSDNFKTLKVGHIIEKIGRKSVIGVDFERVNKIVKNTERPCEYVFRNPKQNASQQRLTRRKSLPVEMNSSLKPRSSRVIKKP